MPLSDGLGPEGIAEVVLRYSPIERNALAGTFLEGGAVGVDGLFQALGVALPLSQEPKGIAEVVLRSSPIERNALAGTSLEAAR